MPLFKQPPRYKEIDLYYTEDGDYFLDTVREDIADTKEDLYRSFVQRVDTIMNYSKGDWILQPTLGAGLSDFLGKKSSAALTRLIKDRIYSELIRDELVRPNEIKIDVIPVTATKIAIILFVKPPQSLETIKRVYYYDLRETKIDRRAL